MYTVCVVVEGRRVNGRNRATLHQAQALAMQWANTLRVQTGAGVPYPVLILDRHGDMVETHG